MRPRCVLYGVVRSHSAANTDHQTPTSDLQPHVKKSKAHSTTQCKPHSNTAHKGLPRTKDLRSQSHAKHEIAGALLKALQCIREVASIT